MKFDRNAVRRRPAQLTESVPQERIERETETGAAQNERQPFGEKGPHDLHPCCAKRLANRQFPLAVQRPNQ